MSRSIQIDFPFNRVQDANGKDYFISQKVSVDIDINLREMIVMFFPGDEKRLPKMVIKPRLYDNEHVDSEDTAYEGDKD